MIYLDSAATSFIKPKSVEYAMINAMHSMASPGRGSHMAAMKAADKVYECRELISELFNFKTVERVVLTMNATHALNIAIRSSVRRNDKVIISGYEHNSVTRVLKDIGTDTVVASAPLFNAEAAVNSISRNIDGAKLVVINHVSNVFGFEQPVYDIAELCKNRGVPLILDASQSAGVCDIDAERIDAAFIAMPGHKGLLGPQGTGILLCGRDPKPLLFGGTGSDSLLQTMPEYLPDRIEAGTHNVVGIAGLAEGVKYVIRKKPSAIGEYERHLCSIMAERLKNTEGFEVFSDGGKNQTGVLSVRHARMSAESLCAEMGKRGVAARCGLHCAPLAHKTVGTLDTGTLRLSFSPFLSEYQVKTAADIIKNSIVHKK